MEVRPCSSSDRALGCSVLLVGYNGSFAILVVSAFSLLLGERAALSLGERELQQRNIGYAHVETRATVRCLRRGSGRFAWRS